MRLRNLVMMAGLGMFLVPSLAAAQSQSAQSSRASQSSRATRLQQTQAEQAQAVPMRERRQALEMQIFTRFLDRVSTDMGLDSAGRSWLQSHLQGSGARRRELAQRTVALRRELMQALRNPNAPDERFARIVNELGRLRREEQRLWEADSEALSRTLTPRQQALFIFEWTRFQDRIRELAAQRPGGQTPRQP